LTLYLVDDRPEPFRPLSWTRPLCELLLGAETFRERHERLSGRRVGGVFSQGRLEGLPFTRLGGSPLSVNPPEAPEGPFLLLDSLYVPVAASDPAYAERSRAARFWLKGKVVGAWLDRREGAAALEALAAREDWREAVRSGEDVELPGRRPAALYRLVARNAEQIAADLARDQGPGASSGAPAGVELEGPRELLRVAPDAELVGPLHVDLRGGPVRIGAGVRVEPFTVLRGPLVVRAGTRILGGEIGAGSTIGRVCRIRGEVQNAIFLGFSNKAHEGFVGDSYVGEWVNLGAGTTTSNLKNNYGHVRQRLAEEVIETGLLKLGSLVGDHVKTGIGTLLPTGAWIGPGTNLYGTRGTAPQYLPAFSWGSGSLQETHRLEAFLESARRMMERRGLRLDPEEAGMLGAVYRATEPDRITA
jgi:UDP-N-acetylglucosamine diphosphorylase/glucosamine-1-phosphate N-acetyltransferase